MTTYELDLGELTIETLGDSKALLNLIRSSYEDLSTLLDSSVFVNIRAKCKVAIPTDGPIIPPPHFSMHDEKVTTQLIGTISYRDRDYLVIIADYQTFRS